MNVGVLVLHNTRVHSWTCFSPRNALMFNNELMADVHFIVGPLGASQRVPAHKVKTHFMSSRSAVGLCQTGYFLTLLCPPLSVRAGRGKLRLLCHVLQRFGGGGVRNTYPRCGTCCFSNSAEVSGPPLLSKLWITHPGLSRGSSQHATGVQGSNGSSAELCCSFIVQSMLSFAASASKQ